MFEEEIDKERTIQDYLNEDCWRAVLSHLLLREIIQSECVSRRWQRIVLVYLQGIRFSVAAADQNDHQTPINAFTFIASISMYESFESWTNKLGSSVVATYCTNQETLKTVRNNCPNLEALTLINFNEPKSQANKNLALNNINEDFKSLNRLCFDNCRVSDKCISQYIADRVLKELAFHNCYEFTGKCLDSANLSNVEALTFNTCVNLQPSHVISSTNLLTELTELELIDIPQQINKKIQSVLDKMPKFKWLEIDCYCGRHNQCYLQNYEPLCCLKQLIHLRTDLKVTNEGVEAITQCCKELQTVEFGNCECLNSEGLQAICQNAGERLTELTLRFFLHLEDDDVVNCVRACPKLTLLSIGGACRITQALPANVSAARHEVMPGHLLCLDLSASSNTGFRTSLEGSRHTQCFPSVEVQAHMGLHK